MKKIALFFPERLHHPKSTEDIMAKRVFPLLFFMCAHAAAAAKLASFSSFSSSPSSPASSSSSSAVRAEGKGGASE